MYRALAKAYGWTPQQCAVLTRAQQIMLAQADENDGPLDDWTPFGLTRDGEHLRGPDSCLERYMAFKRQQKESES